VKFANTVINPRGYRAYVRNDTFFKAIPRVLAVRPGVRFLCPTMADEPQARRWVTELGIADNVHLLPRQTRHQMAELFRSARLVVSPSTHDGTPNTLLEAMACGCLPVAGDIESLREWITPGHNGLLFDPADPQALADAILVGLEQDELYMRAREYNWELVVERAAYYGVMQTAEKFYLQLLKN
jgi:glycosyltransferase involved in cell wall biosynthesis